MGSIEGASVDVPESRDAFVRRFWRTQVVMAICAAAFLGSLFFGDRAMLIAAVLVFPLVWIVIWRVRCWNCGKRLARCGLGEIEYRPVMGLRCLPARHVTCGAKLI